MLKTLSLLLFLNIFCQPAFAQAQRLIHSGFEPGVSITNDLDDITGVDQSTGYDWSSNPSWIKSSRFVYLLSRTLDTSQYQNSRIITAPGPRGNSTKVLKLDNLKDDPANQYVSRNEFSLFAYQDGDGPEYTEGYSRYWMKIPDLRSRIPLADKAPWFLMMEWKEGNTGVSKSAQECADCCGFKAGSTNNYRIGIYIDKARRESAYRWRIHGQQTQPCWNTEWRYTNTTAEVPFGEWILVEAYMKKHPADGRVAFAVNGEMILDTDLTAPEGFTGRTQHKDNPIPLKFWSPLKNYIDTLWYEQGGPISLLYDDLEIWESIPDDASFAQRDPLGSSPGIWLEAESGTVGANWEMVADEEAANGSFVQPMAGFNSREEAPTGVADRVRYRFNVPAAGTYNVWGRVITPTNGDDSFWIRFDNDGWTPWYIGQREDWSWVKQGEVTLAAGQATLDIAYREDGAQLDKLYLTADGDVPTGLGGAQTIGATYLVSSVAEAQSRLEHAIPGDTIVVQNGDYTNFMLNLPTSGTSDNPITLRAQRGGGVNLTGQSGFLVTGDYIVIDGFQFTNVARMSESQGRVVLFEGANYSKLTNCAFYTCGNSRFQHIMLMTGGSTHNEISYNYLEDIVGQGIGVRGEAENTDNHIHHNRLNGTQSDGESNGQEPIQLGQSRNQSANNLNTLVEYNRIENMQGDADDELISNKTKGNTLRYNTCLNNGGKREIVLRQGSDCVVEFNYLSSSGIRAYGNGHTIRGNYSENARYGVRLPGGVGAGTSGAYAETFNCVVEDNLIVNSEREGIQIGDAAAASGGPFIRDIIVRNNQVETNTGTMYLLDEASQGNITWTGNTGEGSATLKTDNITSGVIRGEVDAVTELTPLTEDEVGPDWLNSDTGEGSETGITLEAESCGTIGANWEVKDDGNASGGQYVEIKPGNTSQSAPPIALEDRISYTFEVAKTGEYTLWGRVLTPSSGDDSFWVRMNGEAWQQWPAGTSIEWSWVSQGQYSLSAGSNTLDIAYREDGAQLDKLYLTQQSTPPVGVGLEQPCAPPGSGNTETPTVSFVTPTSGVFYASFIDTYVRVQASDADGIASVRLFLNDQLVRQASSAPYEWGAVGQNDPLLEGLLPGSYTLRAEATDQRGVTASKEIIFSIGEASLPQLPPLVSFVTPEPFLLYSGGTDFYVQVKAELDPNSFIEDKVTSVRLFLDDQLVRQENLVPYEWGAADQNDPLLQDLPPGQYTLRAVATNAAGQQGTQELTLSVGEASLPVTAPLVSFVVPQAEDNLPAGSDLLVRVEARTDPNAGVLGAIQNVRLSLNGQFVRQENIAPYEWGAAGQNDPLLQNLAPGEYRLRVVAVNQGERSGAAELGIVVSEGGQVSRKSGRASVKTTVIGSMAEDEAVAVYPNPTSETLTIEHWGSYSLTMYDLIGRVILPQRLFEGSTDLDVRSIRPGIYMMKLIDAEHRELHRRVIIE